jgi:tetratricopeptide (TPR) repeat protein
MSRVNRENFDVLDLGLRPSLQKLTARAAALAPGKPGATVFLGGEEGSGRTALLDAFVNEVAGKRSPLAIAGTFDSGDYVPHNTALDQVKKATPLAEGALSVAASLHPAAAIVSQLAAGSKSVRRGLEALTKKSQREHPLALLPELLRRAAREEGPLVCAIDDADRSDEAWWPDLMLSLARQIAVDLPLMLVFVVDGPEQLGDHTGAELPGLYVARQLASEDLADWVPLRPCTDVQVEEWIGPAEPVIARRLTEITGGRAGWTAGLWEEWREGGIVRSERDGWSFAGEGDMGLAPIGHLLGRRLQKLAGAGDLAAQSSAQQYLACGALEGRTFTAEAIALVLGQDGDEVVDFLDDNLSIEADPASGLLEELPILTVTDEAGQRHLHRYRFRAELDWLASQQYGLPGESQRNQRLLSLAGALQAVYGAASGRIALVAARLYERAGDAGNARMAQRLHNMSADRETMLLRARLAFNVDPRADQAERNRSGEALVAGATALYNSGPWQVGLDFCEKTIEITDLLSLKRSAHYYAAWFRMHLGDYLMARKDLELALAGAEKQHDRSAVADALHQLANIDLAEERLASAEAGYRRALEIRTELEDREAQARVHEALGDVSHTREDYPGALAEYGIALEISTEIEDRLSWATTRYRVARIEFEEGKLEACRGALGKVVEIQREFGDRRDEIAALSLLSDAEYGLDRFEQARAAAARAVEVAREIGTPHEAGLLYRLATAAASLDDAAEARRAYRDTVAVAERVGEEKIAQMGRRALELLELEDKGDEEVESVLRARLEMVVAAGDSGAEAEARQSLAEFLFTEDRAEEARDEFRQALKLHQTGGDSGKEAEALGYLGCIAYDLDDFPAADRYLKQALALFSRDGNTEWEARGGMCLGALEAARGEIGSARKRLRRSLALQRQIGDSEGEANALQLLKEIEG